MFHIFTLEGKQSDIPLEHLPRHLKVRQVDKKTRTRKLFSGGPGEGQEGTSGSGRYASEAYQRAMRQDNIKPPVFHASEIMSTPVITISPELTAAEAWERFERTGVRHMPVLTGEGKITGILSDRDILKELIVHEGRVENAREVTVQFIMATEVIVSTPLTDIRRIARAMLDHHIGTMPIVGAAGELTGIITRSDILHAVINHPGLLLWA